jgi:adenosylcobinamide kinase/adenosylcobinamide-phosphate guanylyltransferase
VTPTHHTRAVLVLGGARSGKSRYAQALAEGAGRRPVYCATATLSDDAEMRERVARHQAERDGRWTTLEVPLALCQILAAETAPDRVVLVDCLTLWLANLMFAERDIDREIRMLADLVPALPGPVVFVSNEVGSGIVPANALARAFRDHQGRLNQAVAAACDTAVLVTAGLPLLLKPRVEPAVVIGA